MLEKNNTLTIVDDVVTNKIFIIHNQKVMLDRDLANLYQVETKQLKRQAKRNIERFPDDFMFELTREEFEILRGQFGTSSWGGDRYLPLAFTEQGVSMLSSVLNSKRAIDVSIQIMRIFTRIRRQLTDNTEIRLEIEKIKKKLDNQDKNMEIVFRYLDELIDKKENDTARTQIGYKLAY